jgi:hypothetical protein
MGARMSGNRAPGVSHRRALRATADRLRVSFFIGVALVPTLLTQVFTGIGDRVGPWQWSGLLSVALAGFAAHAYLADRRRQRDLAAHGLLDPDLATPVRDLNLITDLILTVDLGKPEGQQQNLHTVLPRLPGLQRIYAVSGPFPGDANARLAALLAEAGAGHVAARVLHPLPAYELNSDDAERLRQQFDGLRGVGSADDVLVADVTGGTVPMSLTTFRAALATGIPVTYTVTRTEPPAGPGRVFHRLVALHDPDSVLTAAPAVPATATRTANAEVS